MSLPDTLNKLEELVHTWRSTKGSWVGRLQVMIWGTISSHHRACSLVVHVATRVQFLFEVRILLNYLHSWPVFCFRCLSFVFDVLFRCLGPKELTNEGSSKFYFFRTLFIASSLPTRRIPRTRSTWFISGVSEVERESDRCFLVYIHVRLHCYLYSKYLNFVQRWSCDLCDLPLLVSGQTDCSWSLLQLNRGWIGK